ncbi:hypothetical protein [Hymenobacter perfusus]|uniref:Uncharacterized protein n=1 Tax=Hymenobacter perfusus TaxID=1236770 RepID=A0A3R9PS41_9BACT|nr:hypothetical protein [Hymenobacter perfusus]RSK44695.1 hypothetical protein EI293_09295 [Hymenobacter perfusus]
MNQHAHPAGTQVLDALTTGAANGRNTHYAQLGNWGRGVDTLSELYAILVAPDAQLNAYGDGSGQRTNGMTVLVREGAPEQWYEMRLQVAGFEQLSPAARVAALADNSNWQRLPAAASVPGGSTGSAGKGTKITFPGRYSVQNRVHELPAGTRSLDVKTAAGRELEPEVDFVLDLVATPPTVTITAPLAQLEGVRLWGYTYLTSTRTKVVLGLYDADHTTFTLAVGVRDVAVFFGSGLALEPDEDYTYDAGTCLLTITASLAHYSGRRVWLWAYN